MPVGKTSPAFRSSRSEWRSDRSVRLAGSSGRCVGRADRIQPVAYDSGYEVWFSFFYSFLLVRCVRSRVWIQDFFPEVPAPIAMPVPADFYFFKALGMLELCSMANFELS